MVDTSISTRHRLRPPSRLLLGGGELVLRTDSNICHSACVYVDGPNTALIAGRRLFESGVDLEMTGAYLARRPIGRAYNFLV